LSTGNYTWHVSAYVDGNWQTVSSDLSFATAAGFDSQFTSDAEGWSPVAGSWTVENGYYKGTRNSTTSYFFSSAYDELFTSLTYEVKLQTSANMSMGLHFRGYSAPLSSSSRWDSGYYFYVYNNIYSIGYFENGQYTAIKNGSWSNGYTWTTLKVIANGSSIQLYINGTRVESITDTRFSAGKVGVEFYADTTTSANMYIDWATLTT
jgi:hypothetical protein